VQNPDIIQEIGVENPPPPENSQNSHTIRENSARVGQLTLVSHHFSSYVQNPLIIQELERENLLPPINSQNSRDIRENDARVGQVTFVFHHPSSNVQNLLISQDVEREIPLSPQTSLNSRDIRGYNAKVTCLFHHLIICSESSHHPRDWERKPSADHKFTKFARYRRKSPHI